MALNLKKLGNFFSPLQVAGQVHIIGCGAIGSWIAMQLVRQGLRDIELWDFDEIDSHNLTNPRSQLLMSEASALIAVTSGPSFLPPR